MKSTEGMTEVEIRLTLPAALALEAEAGGLLLPGSLEYLLREELRRRKIDRLFEAADRLAAVPEPPLAETELESEIHRMRRAKAGSHASGG